MLNENNENKVLLLKS